MMQRGRMLTFHVPNAETGGGMSYDDYIFETEDEEVEAVKVNKEEL